MALGYEGLLAVGAVLSILFLIVLHLMKIDPDDRLSQNGQPTVEETPVLRVKRPFELSVVSQQSDLEAGVSLTVKADFKSELHQLWGVFAKRFFETYHLHPLNGTNAQRSTSKQAVLDVLKDCSYSHAQQNTGESPWTTTLVPSSDAVSYIQSMATSVAQERIIIPLVIVLTFSSNSLNSDLVSSIYFLQHDREHDNRGSWKIISEFLQTINGTVFRVQSIYESGIPQNEIEVDQGEIDTMPSAVCIICHHLQVTRVLLPCRHFCLCAACFHRVRQCPVCRCRIDSYIKLKDESDVVLEGFHEQERNNTQNQLQRMSLGELIHGIWNAS